MSVTVKTLQVLLAVLFLRGWDARLDRLQQYLRARGSTRRTRTVTE